MSTTVEKDSITKNEGNNNNELMNNETVVTTVVTEPSTMTNPEQTQQLRLSQDPNSNNNTTQTTTTQTSKVLVVKDEGEEEKAQKDTTTTTTSNHHHWINIIITNIPKILQSIFFIIMIGQSLPGAEKSIWPFNKHSIDNDSNNNGQKLPPLYVELRSDLYGHVRQFPTTSNNNNDKSSMETMLLNMLLGINNKNDEQSTTLPMNSGIPKEENIVIKYINREYESYKYSIRSVIDSKVVAAREYAILSFQHALEKVLLRLININDIQTLIYLEKQFLQDGNRLLTKQDTLRASIINTTTTTDYYNNNDNKLFSNNSSQCINITEDESGDDEKQCSLVDDNNSTNTTTTNTTDNNNNKNDNTDISSSNETKKITSSTTNTTVFNTTLKEINDINDELTKLITTFLQQITDGITPGVSNAIKDAINGHLSSYGVTAVIQDLQMKPMHTLISTERTEQKKKRLFVTYFTGDIFATAVAELRKEVTAILRTANSQNDEVLIVLQSYGGTVTGYGLVAAQLLRIKNAGLQLTVAVEQVAASGGYLAACVGHTIICSPFAVVGSIGVLQEMPNAYERLKREGIEFHTITAGEYKRVLSPTKEVTTEDIQKAKDELNIVHTLFKDFVYEHRPTLNMTLIATGEVWFGTKAIDVGLCDIIQSADEVLINYIDNGYDVYHVKYEEPVPDLIQEFFDKMGSFNYNNNGIFSIIIQQLINMMKKIITTSLGDNNQNNNNNRVLFM